MTQISTGNATSLMMEAFRSAHTEDSVINRMRLPPWLEQALAIVVIDRIETVSYITHDVSDTTPPSPHAGADVSRQRPIQR